MTITSIEPRAVGSCLGLALAFLGGCSGAQVEEHEPAAESWSVTAWGSLYEIFPEIEPLVAGVAVLAHTHVTRLEDFAALSEGTVAIVLSGAGGEQVFAAEAPVRPGVYSIEIRPAAASELDLAFRVSGPAGSEEIRGGRVLVGSPSQPGGLLVAPAPKGGSDGGEPLAFLKEEQWRGGFSTTWVRPGRLARSVSGLARVRPPAGGEATVTSPVDGVLHPPRRADSWPFVGRRVERGGALFRVVPRVAADRSLPALAADLAAIEAERQTARARLARLEELLPLEATSRRQVEEAQALVETLEARFEAAERDLGSARSSRGGGTGVSADGDVILRAPFAGEVAAVTGSPGATVAAGETVARLVRTDLRWLEVLLSPAAARQVSVESLSAVLLDAAEGLPVRIDGARLISVSPELSSRTGTVTAFVEVPSSADLILGTTLDAQLLFAEEGEGIVVPASAVVDDSGVSVVYLQLSGESFVRQEVEVLERQGDRVLVEGLTPGQRLVTRGGDRLRRSSLLATGDAHGHMH